MTNARWIWVDLENTPHVLFLSPIARALELAGWPTRFTAKPQAQTLDLAEACGLNVSTIGSGDFRGRWQKITGNGVRALALARWLARSERPQLLLSSSRSASLAARLAGIPAIGFLDYEHASHLVMDLCNQVLWLPDLLRGSPLGRAGDRIARYYPGLKENLYLDMWPLDRRAERSLLGVVDSEYLVIARPPAGAAHYANEMGETMWLSVIRRILEWPTARVVVVPRDRIQGQALESKIPPDPRIAVLTAVRPGPGLVAAADLVVGGGGTMNREAAVLGVPAWSTFLGPTPRIDACLASEGRLRWVRTTEDLMAAMSDSPPSKGPRRGPFPDGLETILADTLPRLRGR